MDYISKGFFASDAMPLSRVGKHTIYSMAGRIHGIVCSGKDIAHGGNLARSFLIHRGYECIETSAMVTIMRTADKNIVPQEPVRHRVSLVLPAYLPGK